MSEIGFVVFNVFVNILETFLVVGFVTKYLGFQATRRYEKIAFVLTWLALFVGIQILNRITLFEGFLILIESLILFLYALVVLKGRTLEKLFVSVLPIVCIVLINSIAGGLLTMIWKESINHMILSRSYRYIVTVILTKVALTLVLSCILKLRQELQDLPEGRLWTLFIIILFTSIILVYFIYVTMGSEYHEAKYLGYLLCSIAGIVVMNIVTFYFLKRIGKETELHQQIELLKQNAFYQQENVKNILSEQERVRSMRHDMKNVMLAIQGMLQQNKTEEIMDCCRKYIGEIGAASACIQTGVQAVDHLLAYKLNKAEGEGVIVKSQISRLGSIEIDDVHLCIILGNLLDNAMEALEKENEKRLEMILEKNESYISIFVKNSIQTSVLAVNSNLITTKEDKRVHGFGIRNVKELVKEYGGLISFYEDKGMFVCHIEI